MARVGRVVIGVMLLVVGILMLVLPGPGIVTIAAALAILAKDIPAASRLRDWVKRRYSRYLQ